MKTFEKPIRTEIIYGECINNREISILSETEKAYLIVYSVVEKRGTSMCSDEREITKWIPKSVWENDRNFKDIPYMGSGRPQKHFIPPFFIR